MFSAPGDAPARIGVAITTCDDRHALAPTCHIWVSEKVAWLSLEDRLPQYDRGFTDT